MRFQELVSMIGGRLVSSHDSEQSFRGVSIDSRTVSAGELFVAIRGERHDGHAYVNQALAQGAAGVVVESGREGDFTVADSATVVVVPSAHQALIDLAIAYLERTGARRIGITGSNGKTTTKEMAARMLAAVSNDVYSSPGNFNNLIGVPLALFAMPQATKLAVLEMGISVPGEMAKLSQVVRPEILVITNVGPTHLEFLDTVENVAREKLSALSASDDKAPLVINADDSILMQESEAFADRRVTFGLNKSADYYPSEVSRSSDGTTRVCIDGDDFALSLFGEYQVHNLLAAYVLVRTLGYTFDAVDTEKIELASAPMRGETIEVAGVKFISDCYNANPEAVRQGLVSFANYPVEGRKILILGDMLELGADAEMYHRQIGEELVGIEFSHALLVGPLSKQIHAAAIDAGVPNNKLAHFNSADECAEASGEILQAGDTVYVKGSRGIGLEQIAAHFATTGGRH